MRPWTAVLTGYVLAIGLALGLGFGLRHLTRNYVATETLAVDLKQARVEEPEGKALFLKMKVTSVTMTSTGNLVTVVNLNPPKGSFTNQVLEIAVTDDQVKNYRPGQVLYFALLGVQNE